MRKSFINTLEKVHINNNLNKEEIKILLSATEEEINYLFNTADEFRKKFVGDEIHLRAIIEFSSHCKQNCFYCGLRAENKELKRYRLTFEEILNTAKKAVQLGYKTIVLQSGEDSYFSPKDIACLINEIKKLDVAITLSLGEHDFKTLKLWREAGADRYLLKHETSNPDLFKKLRPKKTLKQRLQCQYWLKQLDYQLGSGFMVGLPGQTLDTLAEDILLMKKMDVDMAGIGPFIPHPQTPLAEYSKGSVDLTLKIIAVTRIVMPLLHLPATTALGTLALTGREEALVAGANVIMPNVTPEKYKAYYQIYPNKICLKEDPEDYLNYIKERIITLGRIVGNDYGHCPKYTRRNLK